MTIDELKAALIKIGERQQEPHQGRGDVERDHEEADQALLAFINDKEVTDLFESLERYYA